MTKFKLDENLGIKYNFPLIKKPKMERQEILNPKRKL
jgi:hypothetical protein